MKAYVATLLVLAISSLVFAGGPLGDMHGGCAMCAQNAAASEQFKRFQQDTLKLRQEMMNKRLDLQRENLNSVPDDAKVAALQAKIASIQARIGTIRAQNGLPMSGKLDGVCATLGMGCDKGMNPGCNGHPCPDRPCAQ